MHDVNASAYIRVPFTVTNPADFATLRLTHRWNDGFIAYVNGTQITAQNAPATPDWNSTATGTHSGGIVDTYDYTLPAGLLRAGTNILAIHGLNVTAADASFLMLPRLDGITAQVASSGYIATPTPGAANAAIKTNVGPFVSNVTKNPNPRPTGTAASPALVITAKVTPSLRPLAATQSGAAQIPGDVRRRAVAEHGSRRHAGDLLCVDSHEHARRRPDAALARGGDGQHRRDRHRTASFPTRSTTSSITAPSPWIRRSRRTCRCSTGSLQSATARGQRHRHALLVLFQSGWRHRRRALLRQCRRPIVHGQSSAGFPKKSYDLDFNEDNRFEWNVAAEADEGHEPADELGRQIEDAQSDDATRRSPSSGSVHHWCYQVRVQQVTPANAATPAKHFFSIADMMEDGDEDFMERNGRDPNGALYKIYDSLAGSGSAEKKTRLFEDKSRPRGAHHRPQRRAPPIATRRQYAYDNLDLPQCVSYFVGCIIDEPPGSRAQKLLRLSRHASARASGASCRGTWTSPGAATGRIRPAISRTPSSPTTTSTCTTRPCRARARIGSTA